MKNLFAFGMLAALCACSDPKAVVVPKSLAKVESIQSHVEKLPQQDRELFGAYLARHRNIDIAMERRYGVKQGSIPDGITIGQAIEQQREFIAKAKAEEAEEKARMEALKAEREQALEQMRGVVDATLLTKKLAVVGYSDVTLDEKLVVKIALKNNGDKEISGVSGSLDVIDELGAELTAIYFAYDSPLKPGESATWTGSRSVRHGVNSRNDRRFAELVEDKFKTQWNPSAIVFFDGSKLSSPE